VRGRAEARWLPSRHNFALFRLAAFVRLRKAKPEPRDAILFIDRHQSGSETWIVGVWLVATIACYVAVTLFGSWPLPLALLTAFALVWTTIQVPMLIIAGVTTLVMRMENHLTVNSFLNMLLYTCAAAYFATWTTWVRFAAWQFLAMLVLNAMAAVLVFLLRDPIARLEAAVSGP
jgi:hypothetical protein